MDEVIDLLHTQSLALHGTTLVPQAPRAAVCSTGSSYVHGEARAAIPRTGVARNFHGIWLRERLMRTAWLPLVAHDPVMAVRGSMQFMPTFAAACGAILYLIFSFIWKVTDFCAPSKLFSPLVLWHTIVAYSGMVLLRTV